MINVFVMAENLQFRQLQCFNLILSSIFVYVVVDAQLVTIAQILGWTTIYSMNALFIITAPKGPTPQLSVIKIHTMHTWEQPTIHGGLTTVRRLNV